MLLLLFLACTGGPDDLDGGSTTTDGGSTTTADGGSTTTADGGSTTPDVARGLWVWDTDIPGDDAETATLLAFAADKDIDTLFLACDPVGYGQAGAADRYAAFVDQAHAADLRVFAMSGYGWFTVPCDAGLPGQLTCHSEGWDLFEACAASEVAFDGIMDDSEPFSVASDTLETAYAQRAAWHLDYLEGLRGRVGALPLHHAIPAWYDDQPALDLDGSGARTLDAWIADRVDAVAVMSYRDDPSLVAAIGATELARGPAWLGVETGAHHLAELTFADEGEAALLAALAELEATLGAEPHLEGLMVHSYRSWQALAEGR